MRFNQTVWSRYIVLLAHFGVLITVIFWGTSFLSTKVLMEDAGFTPVEMYVYRFALSYIVLLFMTFKHIKSRSWRDELTFFVSGICAGSLYFITENYALRLTTAGNVSLLASISPLFTTFLMALVFRQKIKFGVWIGSALAIVGVACIIFSNGASLEIRPQGDLLALSAALCWAIYTIAIRRVIPLYTSLFITRKLFLYGVLTALPLLYIQNEPYHFGLLLDIHQPKYMLNMVFLVLLCSVFAYLIWNEAMKKLGSVTANNYLYLQPPITMISGYFFLGEKIFLLGYIGCVLVIGGLIVSDKWNGSIWFRKK
ncbi:MAG: DMT family transporter [Muribaculaceae bacterium]|nr:DMT family transporter [Muribaculaceae bacterium]